MGREESPPQPVSEGGGAAMIDKKSMADYREHFEKLRQENYYAYVVEIQSWMKEYIEKKLDGVVDEECKKRVMDLTTVALSTLSSMVIPFSGVAVVVAATVIQCLDFSSTLGLIPLLNVRSSSDLVGMTKQIGSTIKRAGKSSVMAGVETAIIEILKKLGLGDWLWAEILRDILYEMIGDAALDAAWIMVPLLAAPKYMMHRHLVKKMYRKLGDKANVVHKEWMMQNCGALPKLQTAVVTQVAGGVQVDALGNVQGAYVEVCASQVVTDQPPANGYNYQQHAYPPSNLQAPSCNDPYPAPGMVPGMVQGYPQQMLSPENGANLFQPQPAAKPTATVIMGYTPPANSSFFQPQPAAKPTGTLIMGHTPPANSSFFQPQTEGNFQFAAAAAQVCTPAPNPTYVQQLPPYATLNVQQMTNLPQANPYVQMGEYNKPQAQQAYPPSAGAAQQMYPPQANPYAQMGDQCNMPQASQHAYPPRGAAHQQAYPPQAQQAYPPVGAVHQQQVYLP